MQHRQDRFHHDRLQPLLDLGPHSVVGAYIPSVSSGTLYPRTDVLSGSVVLMRVRLGPSTGIPVSGMCRRQPLLAGHRLLCSRGVFFCSACEISRQASPAKLDCSKDAFFSSRA